MCNLCVNIRMIKMFYLTQIISLVGKQFSYYSFIEVVIMILD